MPRAALFDLDRTLVRRETASMYVRYQRERGDGSLRQTLRVSLWVFEYTLGFIDAKEVAAKAIRSLSGTHETALSARCDDWFTRRVEVHVADAGRRAVAMHKARGDIVAIVTGATPYTAWPLARRLGIEHVVASELEKDARGFFTGRFEEPLCFGEGKLARSERLARTLGFALEESVFYTDSITDLPLLERVREPVAVNPDLRLRRVAARRGFRVERW